jgi:2-phospho-L-lactate guanylyltransferase
LPVTVVIPVKQLGEAKSRLSAVLSPMERRDLVLEMLHTVMSGALRSAAEQVVVLAKDEVVGSAASRAGAVWVPDPAENLNESLRYGFELCWEKGETPLYLPADLPLVQAQHVDGVLTGWGGEEKLIISPSVDKRGTNALLLPRSCRLDLCFGVDSFRLHLEQASRKGFGSAIYYTYALAFDVDTPEDLHFYRSSRVLDGVSR